MLLAVSTLDRSTEVSLASCSWRGVGSQRSEEAEEGVMTLS